MRNLEYMVLLLMALLFSAVTVHAGDDRDELKDSRVAFAYDINFDMHFDNREFDVSDNFYLRSQTLFSTRLTPAVGISIDRKKKTSHRVMVGIDLLKNFGRSPIAPEMAGPDAPEASRKQDNLDVFDEVTMYYQLRTEVGKKRKTLIDMNAGVFPKKFMAGEYSKAVFSDSLMFYDRNIEGLLVSFKRPNARYEIGCDWMGEYGDFRRERFMIFASGNVGISRWLDFSYAGYLYHYANSAHAGGVVDNMLLNPHFDFKFQSLLPLQKLELKLGAVLSAQNDRDNIGTYTFPVVGEVTAEIRNWNAGIRNSAYFGTNMMPYYNNLDKGGFKYGNMLYLGSPMFRMSGDLSGKISFYDELEVYYQPKIASFVDMKISLNLHFNERYLGWQQMVGVIFHFSH